MNKAACKLQTVNEESGKKEKSASSRKLSRPNIS